MEERKYNKGDMLDKQEDRSFLWKKRTGKREMKCKMGI
jgi:hypothetical protein